MLITTNVIAREMVNGAWFVVSLYLTGIFTLFLSTELRSEGWFHNKTNQAAVGLVLYFAGNALFHGCIWFLLVQARTGFLYGHFVDSYLFIVLSAMLAFAGAYLSIRMFIEKPKRTRALMCVIFVTTLLMVWEVYS